MIEQYAPLLSLFLIQGRAHCFRFLLSFICSWLSNKPRPTIVNNHIILLLSMASVFLKKTRLLHKEFFLHKDFLFFVLKNVYF